MEEFSGRDRIREWFVEYVADVLGPDVDPDSLSCLDIRALPQRDDLKQLPYMPEHEPEVLSGLNLKRVSREEAFERAWRAENFLKMPEVEFPAEEKAAA